MAVKCIKCEYIAQDRKTYPCKSCKEVDKLNHEMSHFKERIQNDCRIIKRKITEQF